MTRKRSKRTRASWEGGRFCAAIPHSAVPTRLIDGEEARQMEPSLCL